MHRLNTMAPELVSKINDASAVKQQALTAAACFFAVSLLTEVDKQVLAEARDLLVHGKAAPAAFLEQLEQLAWSYDEKYLALQDRNDYLPYFSRPQPQCSTFGSERQFCQCNSRRNIRGRSRQR